MYMFMYIQEQLRSRVLVVYMECTISKDEYFQLISLVLSFGMSADLCIL